MYILGENTSKYCSKIIVVHVHATVLISIVHPACPNITNGIKPLSDSKKTDKHAVDCSKAVRCINCSYNNVASGIPLLDKRAFSFIQGKFHASKSFSKIHSLKLNVNSVVIIKNQRLRSCSSAANSTLQGICHICVVVNIYH